ncbi:hypothetical protein JX266_009204 [Neoarthrinium moseri]|nr:hypothetical protein JX266_009204 [Neoarthrinium moseri]
MPEGAQLECIQWPAIPPLLPVAVAPDGGEQTGGGSGHPCNRRRIFCASAAQRRHTLHRIATDRKNTRTDGRLENEKRTTSSANPLPSHRHRRPERHPPDRHSSSRPTDRSQERDASRCGSRDATMLYELIGIKVRRLGSGRRAEGEIETGASEAQLGYKGRRDES